MKNYGLWQKRDTVAASVPSRTKPHPRILVVDDDSDMRLLYANVLASPSYRVDAVEDGAIGWEALQANNYNLLITEHSLPRLTGVELVRKLRAARMALPVIMAAGRLPARELVHDPELQLAAVLPKPFYLSQLLDTVKAVLSATDTVCEQVVPTVPLPLWRTQPPAIGLRF